MTNNGTVKSIVMKADYSKPLTVRYAFYEVHDASTGKLMYYVIEDNYTSFEMERFGEDMVMPEISFRAAMQHWNLLNQHYEIQEGFKLLDSLREELRKLRDLGADITKLPNRWNCIPQSNGTVLITTRLGVPVTTLDNMAAVDDYLLAFSHVEKQLIQRMQPLTPPVKKRRRKAVLVG